MASVPLCGSFEDAFGPMNVRRYVRDLRRYLRHYVFEGNPHGVQLGRDRVVVFCLRFFVVSVSAVLGGFPQDHFGLWAPIFTLPLLSRVA